VTPRSSASRLMEPEHLLRDLGVNFKGLVAPPWEATAAIAQSRRMGGSEGRPGKTPEQNEGALLT
jgi:hypothetical protein